MRFRHLAAMAATTVLLTLTACGTQTAGSPGADSVPPPIGTEPEELPSDEQPDDGADAPPGSERSKWASFVNALDAIDPDIVHSKEDQAVDRARSQCQAIKENPHDQDKLIEQTNKRFTSPNNPEGHGLDTAEKILNVVERYVCPKTGGAG